MASKYEDRFCTEVVRFGSEGKSQTQMAAALGVDRHTLADWKKDPRKPEFCQAMKLALTLSQAYWESIGQQGTRGVLPKFVANSWIYIMKNRFPDEWKEVSESRIDLNSSVKQMTDEELEETIKVLTARKAVKDNGSSGAPAQVA